MVFHVRVVVASGGALATVPIVVPDPSPPLTTGLTTSLPASVALSVPASNVLSERDTRFLHRETPRYWTSLRIAGAITGGVGLAALAAGGYFGVRAFQLRHASERGCSTPLRLCDQHALSQNDAAATAADLSTGLFVVGVAALGVGTGLFLRGTPPAAHPRAAIVVQRSSASVAFSQAF